MTRVVAPLLVLAGLYSTWAFKVQPLHNHSSNGYDDPRPNDDPVMRDTLTWQLTMGTERKCVCGQATDWVANKYLVMDGTMYDWGGDTDHLPRGDDWHPYFKEHKVGTDLTQRLRDATGMLDSGLIIIDAPDYDWYSDKYFEKTGVRTSGAKLMWDHIFALEFHKGYYHVLHAWRNWFCTNDWLHPKKPLDRSVERCRSNGWMDGVCSELDGEYPVWQANQKDTQSWKNIVMKYGDWIPVDKFRLDDCLRSMWTRGKRSDVALAPKKEEINNFRLFVHHKKKRYAYVPPKAGPAKATPKATPPSPKKEGQNKQKKRQK